MRCVGAISATILLGFLITMVMPLAVAVVPSSVDSYPATSAENENPNESPAIPLINGSNPNTEIHDTQDSRILNDGASVLLLGTMTIVCLPLLVGIKRMII